MWRIREIKENILTLWYEAHYSPELFLSSLFSRYEIFIPNENYAFRIIWFVYHLLFPLYNRNLSLPIIGFYITLRHNFFGGFPMYLFGFVLFCYTVIISVYLLSAFIHYSFLIYYLIKWGGDGLDDDDDDDGPDDFDPEDIPSCMKYFIKERCGSLH